MAGIDNQITTKIALHHERNLTGPVKEQNINLEGRGPYFAQEAMRLADPNQRYEALVRMGNMVEQVMDANKITGRNFNNVNDLRQFAQEIESKAFVPVAGEASAAEELQNLYYDITDGVAVATLAALSTKEDIANMISNQQDPAVSVENGLKIAGNLQGLGEVIVRNTITDHRLRKRLTAMQRKMEGGSFDLTEMVKAADNIENDLLAERVNESEAQMVLAYLSSIAGAEKEELEQIDQLRMQFQIKQERTFDAQQELAERNLRLGKEAEATTYDNWKGAIFSKAGQVGLPSAIWALSPPDYFKGTGTEWNEFLDSVTSMSNKVMQRKAALGGARDIGKAWYDENYPKIQERGFALDYNDERTGLANALEAVVKDLFVETITEDRSGNLVIRKITEQEKAEGKKGQFVMKYNVQGVSNREQRGAWIMAGKSEGGRREYLMTMADRLVQDGIEPDFDHACMAVSMAMDFLELGFAMDAGDHQRQCNFTVENARAKCRPGFKFGAKTSSGEVFVPAWNAFYKEKFSEELDAAVAREKMNNPGSWDEQKEKNFRNGLIVEMARKDGLIPQVLAGSILDSEFVVGYDDRQKPIKMTLGRAMEAGIKLDLNTGSTEDLLVPTNKGFEAASDMWDYMSQEKEFSFKGGLVEADAIISKFGKGLNNAYAELKNRGLVNIHDLVAAVGGASGLIPSDPPILNVQTSNNKMPYEFIGGQLVSYLPVLTASEKQYVIKYFGFDTKFARAAPSIWKSSMDVRMSPADRQYFKDVLRNRGDANAKKFRASLG